MIPILVELLLVIADGANFLDNEIFQLENDLIEAIPPARLAKSGVTRDDYELQVSYGVSIIAANVFYTASTVWDKNITDFTFVDWGTIAANTGYAWGYAGLWLVDGQLDSPDPGCGLQELYDAQDSSPLPSLYTSYSGLTTSFPSIQPVIMRQAVIERDLAVRSALGCLKGEGNIDSILDRLKSAYLTRLDITQTVIDTLY